MLARLSRTHTHYNEGNVMRNDNASNMILMQLCQSVYLTERDILTLWNVSGG